MYSLFVTSSRELEQRERERGGKVDRVSKSDYSFSFQYGRRDRIYSRRIISPDQRLHNYDRSTASFLQEKKHRVPLGANISRTARNSEIANGNAP